MPPEPPTISTAELTQIVRAFADSDLRELRLVVGDVDLLVSRNEHIDGAAPARPAAPAPAAASAPAPAPTAAPTASAPSAASAMDSSTPAVDRTGLIPVHSPSVGVFYRRPTPEKPPYVEVGSAVAVGDPVGTLEVMKMFTTVPSEVAGTVAEICVEDATLVEYQQVIMYLSPAAGA
ncbi:acetyl-CoA carboxylase, biotin carboxyl carrier protein [Micromonospora sicca]|uniref:Biotin carboxyl carrier protein of acetyl-CoA carboxylase n=1 Tax=Micromonospora sicca TaxID=2202420 RepID=A0A317DFU4_9ACTN|nr:biotin/lipoyl-containing protein [Micromonospora sp. 4G51]PWR13618.1 acetyl-CoA carboxylase, biotin carboxyl carrier protein [Micromonospora sp. 4G51]